MSLASGVSNSEESKRCDLNRLKLLGSAAVVFGLIAVWVGLQRDNAEGERAVSSGEASKSAPQSGTLARPKELSGEQYDSAEKAFRQAYPEVEVTNAAVLMMAGDLAMKEGQLHRAVACYHNVPTSDLRFGLPARLEEGAALLELNLADQAELAFRQFIEAARLAPRLQADQVVDAFKRLSYILSVEIRQEDRQKVLLEQHQLGLVDPLDSKQLFFPNLLILNSPAGKKRIAGFLAQDPDNARLQLANARYKTLEGSFEEAVQLLEQLYQQQPQELQVVAALAEAYFEMGDNDKFDELLQNTRTFELGEPWLLTRMRGEFTLGKKQWLEASQHFQNVLANDPADAPAQMGLAKAFTQLEMNEQHRQALQRSSLLAEIRVNLSSVQPDAVSACHELAAKCSQIGMEQAAQVFGQHAQNIQRALQMEAQEGGQQREKPDKESTSP